MRSAIDDCLCNRPAIDRFGYFFSMNRRGKPYRSFSAPQRMIVAKVNRAPKGEGVCNRNLGQDYEETSFGRRFAGSDRLWQRGTSGGSSEGTVPLWRRSLQELLVPRPLSRHRLLQPLRQLLPA